LRIKGEDMISIEEALGTILQNVEKLPPRRMKVGECLGRVLGEDIRAREDIPPFTNSAMDGFAVRAGDTKAASPKSPRIFQVLEDLRAGETTRTRVGKGEAIRIMTGAPLPPGADAVVMVEDTRGTADGMEILKPVRAGENVREAGESVRKGETVLPAGTLLRPQEIGMLAALGYPRPWVIPPPAAAIVTTGDELLDISAELKPGKIRDCNRYSLAAAVERCGGVPVPLAPAGDREGELKARLQEALTCDLVITSGGVSAGKYDLVREALRELGGELLIRKVRMKPGKPLTFTRVGKTPVFSLPGNPVSVLVSFLQFVRPALLKMQGKKKLSLPEVEATLSEDCLEETDRTHLVRVRVEREGEGYSVRPTGPQGSGILKSLILADGLMVIPPGAGPLPAGTRVRVLLLGETPG
jgi:molybdopterin molybdotransferase